MAQCVVGATGGGKVTVAGLSAEVVLDGTEVIVKQGAKTVQSVTGKLDILAWGQLSYNGGEQFYYWNGSGDAVVSGRNVGDKPRKCTIPGVFKKALYRCYGATGDSRMYVKVGGNTVYSTSSTSAEFTEFTDNIVEFSPFSLAVAAVVVLGSKN